MDADNAIPGEMDSESGKKDDTTKAHKAAPGDGEEEKKSWIEIEMVDQEDKRLPGMPYRVTLADGETVAEGTLDEKGFARIDHIDPGSCKVTFPTLDQEAWEEI